jgi:hypothetical protein
MGAVPDAGSASVRVATGGWPCVLFLGPARARKLTLLFQECRCHAVANKQIKHLNQTTA